MHSWIRRNGSFDSYDSNATFDERISDAIPSTCGGGRKAKSNTTRSTQNDSFDPYDTANRPLRVFDDEPPAVNENQYPPKRIPSRSRQNIHDPNTTPTGTRQLTADRSNNNNNNMIPERQSGAQTPNSSIVSEDSFVRRARQKIENQPIPGKAVALRLQRLVNLPFRCVFGPESRIPSSQDLEVQRAGSSYPQNNTPFQNLEPQLQLHDSPRIDNLPPDDGNKTQHLSTGQQQTQREEYRQNEIPSRSPTMPTQQQQNVLPSRHDKENQTEDILFHSPPPQQEQQQSPSPFLNRQQQQHHPSPPKNVFNNQNNRHNSTFQNSSTLSNNRLNQSYLPTSSIYYRHSPRPLAPPINVDSWALGPKNYRSIYLDNLVNQLRDSESKQAELRIQLNRFDKQRRQELDELDLLTREQELSIRKRQHEQRLREQEELEKNTFGYTQRHLSPTRYSSPTRRNSSPPPHSSSITTTRPPFLPPRPLAPILKKTTTTTTSTTQPQRRSASLPRVAFNSPAAVRRPSSPVRPVNNHHHNNNSRNNNVRPTSRFDITSQRGRQLLQQRGRHHQQNIEDAKTRKYIENRGIEEEDRRANYIIKWHSNYEQLKKAKRCNSNINLKSNPTSLFDTIPGGGGNFVSSTTNRQ